jgi:thiamine biosynthesis lipoprotein
MVSEHEPSECLSHLPLNLSGLSQAAFFCASDRVRSVKLLRLMTSPNLFQYRFAALGTECAVYLYAASQAEADRVFDAAEAEVGRIEAKYSRYREYSELARINRAAARGEAVEVDLETGALLDYAFLAYAKSDGLFDITSGILRRAWDFRSGKLPEPPQIEALLPSIGMDKLVWRAPELSFRAPSVELDFGGIGKEYAVDRVADILLSMGVRHTMIDLGGDLRAIGPQWNSQPWEILLRNPVKPNAELA